MVRLISPGDAPVKISSCLSSSHEYQYKLSEPNDRLDVGWSNDKIENLPAIIACELLIERFNPNLPAAIAYELLIEG